MTGSRITRDLIVAAFRDAVTACDPGRLVRESLIHNPVSGRAIIGIAMGKAALAMARGAGPVARGIAVTPEPDGGGLPDGWSVMQGGHPEPDARSVSAGAAIVELLARTGPDDVVLALISGGASALVEQPAIPLDEFCATVGAVMRSGVAIDELNTVRIALSTIKAGGLAVGSPAPVVTLAVSDVIGDDLAVIGSGPTIGPWIAAPGVDVDLAAWRAIRRTRALVILARLGIALPALPEPSPQSITRTDRARVVGPMTSFADAIVAALVGAGHTPQLLGVAIAGEVSEVATRLATESGLVVAWGEPTLEVPADHGVGGRAQQLALELARHLRGTDRIAFVAGSDGIDGPPIAGQPTAAGAFVDGASWDAIVRAGIDPSRALAHRDARTALASIDALVVTGPTGINHGDIVIVG